MPREARQASLPHASAGKADGIPDEGMRTRWLVRGRTPTLSSHSLTYCHRGTADFPREISAVGKDFALCGATDERVAFIRKNDGVSRNCHDYRRTGQNRVEKLQSADLTYL